MGLIVSYQPTFVHTYTLVTHGLFHPLYTGLLQNNVILQALTMVVYMRLYTQVDMVVILHTMISLRDRSMPTKLYVVQSKKHPAGCFLRYNIFHVVFTAGHTDWH